MPPEVQLLIGLCVVSNLNGVMNWGKRFRRHLCHLQSLLCHLPHNSRLSRLALCCRLHSAKPLAPPVTLQQAEQVNTMLQFHSAKQFTCDTAAD